MIAKNSNNYFHVSPHPTMTLASRISSWFNSQLLDPLKSLPNSGKISALGAGLWIGIFPFPGVSTFVLIFLIQILKMRGAPFNTAQSTISIAMNLIATPVMLLLIPIWLSMGSRIFGLEGCNAGDIIPALKESVITAFTQFTGCILSAILAWVVISPAVLLPLYLLHKRSATFFPREDRVPLIHLEGNDTR